MNHRTNSAPRIRRTSSSAHLARGPRRIPRTSRNTAQERTLQQSPINPAMPARAFVRRRSSCKAGQTVQDQMSQDEQPDSLRLKTGHRLNLPVALQGHELVHFRFFLQQILQVMRRDHVNGVLNGAPEGFEPSSLWSAYRSVRVRRIRHRTPGSKRRPPRKSQNLCDADLFQAGARAHNRQSVREHYRRIVPAEGRSFNFPTYGIDRPSLQQRRNRHTSLRSGACHSKQASKSVFFLCA